MFACDNRTCIDVMRRCDMRTDCLPDGEDEAHCGQYCSLATADISRCLIL